MIIIKHLNKNWFFLIGLSLFFNSCCSQNIVTRQENINCVLHEMDLTEFKISSSNSYIANNEFENYFQSTFKYDVLKYSGKSGEIDYNVDRWYYKEKDTFVHIKIASGVKSVREIYLKESEVSVLFQKLQSQSYFKVCKNCFGCENGILLLKNDEIFFKYHFDGVFNNGLSDVEKERIIKAIEVLNFFSNQW